ncbi:hypothetical protein K501DRAFT_269806 [Backusella circina FSU 941]|nr:hypothetical protein K501DRAFT_269806 [Backusella circina FSU 941]
MKFGANLQRNIYPPWDQEYIQYNKLKFYLKERQQSLTGWTKTDERYFAESLVVAELDKVYQFIDLKLKNTETRVKEMRQLDFSNNFDAELQCLNVLLEFIEINSIGFQKIVQKHNSSTCSDLNQYIKIRNYSQRFETFKTRADQLLNNINEICHQKTKKIDIIRENKKRESAAVSTRTIVATFWVHPDNLSEVQATILFNLPNINSNSSTQPFHSMILDNSVNFTLYSDLIERKRKAELIQIEWQEGNSDFIPSVELRVYQESWTNKLEYFIADTFLLNQHHIKDYLDDSNKERARKKLNVSIPTSKHDSISALIERKQLEPMISVLSNRSIYQKSAKSNLQVTIDTNVRFLNEKKMRKEYKPTAVDAGIEQSINYSENQPIQSFPFALLELKQEVNNTSYYQPIPNWLSELIDGGLLYEVPLFSPYLHGISCFYQNHVSLLPWWLDEIKNDVRKGNSTQNSKRVIDNNADYFTSLNYSYNKVAEVKTHAVVNITNDKKPEYFQQKQHYKPDEIYDIDMSFFGNTSFNSYENGLLPSFYNLTDGMDLASHNQMADNKSDVAAHEILLENPIISKIKNLKENSYSSDCEEAGSKYEDIGMASWLLGRLRRRRPNSVNSSIIQDNPPKREKPKKKLEPKILFANERTFISWLQFSAFLLTVSLGLINFGDSISKCSGGFFIIISVLLALYALLRFQYRSWQIRMRNDARFDDRWGPAVLCIVLVIALIINLGLRVSQPVPTNPSLFGQQQDDMLTDKMGGNIHVHNPSTTEDNGMPKNGDIDQNKWKGNKNKEHKNESKDLHKSINGKLNNNDDDDDEDED